MVGRGVHEVYINGGSTDIALISYRSNGRPKTAIGKEQLEAFLKLKIPLSKIASALHVSRPTLYKAIRDYNINYKRFSDASEAEIRQAVEVIRRSHPEKPSECWRIDGYGSPEGSRFPCSKIKSQECYTPQQPKWSHVTFSSSYKKTRLLGAMPELCVAHRRKPQAGAMANGVASCR